MPALTNSQAYTLSQNATYRGQVQAQMIRYAGQILSQVADRNKPDSRQTKLINLAKSIIQNPSGHLESFSLGIAVIGPFDNTAAATDAEISAKIVTAFPIIAGITNEEQ
jgi:hypothetical protein